GGAWVIRGATKMEIERLGRRRKVSLELGLVDDGFENAALRIALGAALAAFSRRQREVVSLRYVGGLTEGEVASCLGISVNSVKKHMLRGTTSLREQLGGEWREVESVAD